MSKRQSGSHAISGAFVFLLLGVFAVFATVMVLLGVGAYNHTTDSAAEHNAARVAPAYLRTMVRGHDGDGGVRAERLTGIQREDEDTGETSIEAVDLSAVVLDDEEAVTRMFVYDGWLYECSEPKDDFFDPDEDDWGGEDDAFDDEEEEPPLPEGVCRGYRMQPVCEAEGMEAQALEGLLMIRLKSGGAWSEIACALHGAMP